MYFVCLYFKIQKKLLVNLKKYLLVYFTHTFNVIYLTLKRATVSPVLSVSEEYEKVV